MEPKTKTKICPHCKKDLPIESFGANRHQLDGHQVYCRDCCRSSKQESRARQRVSRLLNACAGDIPEGFLQMAEDAGVYQCAKCRRWLSRGQFYHTGGHRAAACRHCTDIVSSPLPSSPGDKPIRSTRLTGESFMDQFRDYCGGLLPEHCLPPVEEGAEGAEGAEP